MKPTDSMPGLSRSEFANLLQDHNVALVLQDRSWMPSSSELKFDPITADWTYIRWLGDRKAIEERTMTWNKTIIDRTENLKTWVDFCYQIMKRGVLIYAYANNHFAGHGPATIEMFRSIWQAKGHTALPRPLKAQQRRPQSTRKRHDHRVCTCQLDDHYNERRK